MLLLPILLDLNRLLLLLFDFNVLYLDILLDFWNLVISFNVSSFEAFELLRCNIINIVFEAIAVTFCCHNSVFLLFFRFFENFYYVFRLEFTQLF